ncbi:MAG: response regulator [Candidatus Nomurabacteria bacterium]|nr:response regulator [Candidatus Nomurabacteria bacterium]
MNITNKKIMIVEDNELISKVYQTKFIKEGFEIFLARDGEEAVKKITTEKPDMILLDLMIPKKDGFGVLEDIKKIPVLAKIPVIVLSNLGQQKDKDRALELGANEYLIKVDSSIQEIVDKVKGYLG